MSLTSIFVEHVPEERRAELGAPPSEEALAALVRAGREAWPGLALDAADFVAFLGRTLPASAAAHLPELRGGDLWLACAYGRGVRGAAAALDGHYLPRVRGMLGKLGTGSAEIEDVLQELRERLVEMSAPAPDHAGYSGRGDLGGWLCIAGVRAANRRRERRGKEQTLENAESVLLPAPEEDPEMAFLQREYREELLAAFREALASLSPRDRNLLRYHFIDGVNIDKLGALYGVNRTTAWRWVTQAREELCNRTRENLCRRVSLSEAGFQRVLGLIESQIRVSLEAMTA